MCQWTVPVWHCNWKLIVSLHVYVCSGLLILIPLIAGSPTDGINPEKVDLSDKATFQIDKTMFIKDVISQANKTLIITAPNGFGKSTNLKILKSFLEIEVDKTGTPKTKVNRSTEQIRDTRNYYTFTKNKLKITECTHFMNEYFGKYPVVDLSFECFAVVRSVEDAVNFYKRAIHSSYKDHEYLVRSERLSYNERKFARFWCDDHNYFSMSRQQVVTGVRELAQLVSRHHDSKVWVLVDDYDSVVQAATVEVAEHRDFARILNFTSRMMSYAFRNIECVCGGVLTGVWSLSIFNTTQYQKYSFQEYHQFVDYYGLAVGDVETFFINRSTVNNKLVPDVRAFCGGYNTKCGKEIYNLKAVTSLLETGKTDSYNYIARISDFTNIFKIRLVRETIEKLLTGETVSFHNMKEFSEKDLLQLRSILLNPQVESVPEIHAMSLSYLLQEGILTLASDNYNVHNGTYVKIPNRKIEEEVNKLLKVI